MTDYYRQTGRCPAGMNFSHGWGTSDLLGYTLKLVDSERLIQFMFGDATRTAATVGRVRVFTSPVLSWDIDKEGVLTIGDEQISYTFRKVCAGERGFIVEWDGELLKFTKQRIPAFGPAQ